MVMVGLRNVSLRLSSLFVLMESLRVSSPGVKVLGKVTLCRLIYLLW